MKNIAFFAVLVSLILPTYLWGLQDIGLSIETGGGFLSGMAKELVYRDPDEADLLSELLWPMDGMFLTSIAIGYGKHDPKDISFYMDVSFRLALPGKTGTMTDKDWLHPYTYLTHFSAHDCFTKHVFLGDFKMGYYFPLFANIHLAPILTFSTMSFSWVARDGYLQYGPNFNKSSNFLPWNENFDKLEISGDSITYDQDWLILSTGFEFAWFFWEYYELRGSLEFMPFIVCGAQDVHLERQLRFTDTMMGNFGMEPAISIRRRISNVLYGALELQYRYIAPIRGDTTEENLNDPESEAVALYQSAGAGYQDFTIGLKIGLRF